MAGDFRSGAETRSSARTAPFGTPIAPVAGPCVVVSELTGCETTALPVLCCLNNGIPMRFSRSVAYLFVYGLLSFGLFCGHRQFASLRVLDVVELLLSGACFGAALVLLIAGKRRIE